MLSCIISSIKKSQSKRSDSFFVAGLFAASLQHQRGQVDQRENDDPHDINEVPVHLGGLDREMVFGGEIAAHRADQTDQQEDRADRHVQAVEARQREEGRAKDGGLGGKVELPEQAAVLNDLAC